MSFGLLTLKPSYCVLLVTPLEMLSEVHNSAMHYALENIVHLVD